MAIQKFEDIIAWQKARELTKFVYDITASGNFARDFGLRDQIRRASVSVMSNIAEGFDRNSHKELRQFFFIAKASSSEVKSQLYIALDFKYITQDQFDYAYNLSCEVAKLLTKFIQSLKIE